MDDVWAVLLAGGSGTRFWPRSRASRPKQVLALLDERPLVQLTSDRIAPIVPIARQWVWTGRKMEAAVRAAIPGIAAENVRVEPSGRNTAPAIAWALVETERRGGGAMVVLPTDHRIRDVEGFHQVVQDALFHARATDELVLLGQSATHPATGFGWIVPRGSGRIASVERFVEKPPAAIAERLLADGALWNGGMFVWTTRGLRRALEACLPKTLAAAERLIAAPEAWEDTEPISIDHGVLEHWPHTAVIRCDFGWDDLGSWPAMESVFPAAEGGVARGAEVLAIGASGNIVDAEGLVALIGVQDLVVVCDGDVLMVAAKERLSELPALLARMRAEGRADRL